MDTEGNSERPMKMLYAVKVWTEAVKTRGGTDEIDK